MRKPVTGRHAVDHTTSRRHRAGSRRNKRLRNVGTFLTDLTHTQRWGCRPGRPQCPMAMRLTRCEQRWVDDVRARQPHVHEIVASSHTLEVRVPGATIVQPPVVTVPDSVLHRVREALSRKIRR